MCVVFLILSFQVPCEIIAMTHFTAEKNEAEKVVFFSKVTQPVNS